MVHGTQSPAIANHEASVTRTTRRVTDPRSDRNPTLRVACLLRVTDPRSIPEAEGSQRQSAASTFTPGQPAAPAAPDMDVGP